MPARESRTHPTLAALCVGIVLTATGGPAFAIDRRVATVLVAPIATPGRDGPQIGPALERPVPQASAERARIEVAVDRAKVIRLPDSTRTVVVGNPAIADVAVQKNGVVVLTGKSFGETNMIALDSGGRLLAESALTVTAATQGIVTVSSGQRGLERQSYSCTPTCMPAVQLGDSATFFAGAKDQAVQHGQFSNSR